MSGISMQTEAELLRLGLHPSQTSNASAPQGMMQAQSTTPDYNAEIGQKLAILKAQQEAAKKAQQDEIMKRMMKDKSYRNQMFKWLQQQRGMMTGDGVLPVAQQYWTDKMIQLLQPPQE